jgi:uncharacterized NAD(P)/FAD-binding protein YdhS
MGRTSTVVVGGGCSGVLVAAQLLRHTTDQVTMLEPGPTLGTGIAYATPVLAHVLNSRALAMSGDPDNPDDFVAWSHRQGDRVDPDGFAVRRDYGRYLRNLLDAAAAANPGRFSHVRARATGIGVDGRVRVVTDRAGDVVADRVVLAIGHSTPVRPRQVSDAAVCHPGYVADPWRPGALDAVDLDAPVLLLGSGLTAIDMALQLQALGAQAPIHAVSRHGLLPLVHPRHPGAAAAAVPSDVDSLAALIRQTRVTAEDAADWRDAVDAIRPHVNALWDRLSAEDRRRFLRHASRYWEVHRHRMAPSVAVLVRGMLADNALRVRAATLSSVTVNGPALLATATSGARWRVGTVVNCTGPGSSARSSLGRALLAAGIARPDPLNIGFDVDAHGHLVSGAGQPHQRVLAVGPPRRGQWWETDAVPEIRTQARALLHLPSQPVAPSPGRLPVRRPRAAGRAARV